MLETKWPGDTFKAWLELGKQMLREYYPESPHAVLVIETGEGGPAAQFVIRPDAAVCGAVPLPTPRG